MSNTPEHCCKKCGQKLQRTSLGPDVLTCTSLKCKMLDILVYITLPLKAHHG